MGYAPIDVGNFKTLDAVVGDVGHEVYVVNIELAVFLSLRVDLTEKLDFLVIEILAYLLYHPDVSEKLGTQVSVTHNGLANHVQVSVNQLNHFLLRTNALGCHLVEPLAETLQFTLDDSIVDFLLRLKISIECTPSLARRQGNVVHRRILYTILGK